MADWKWKNVDTMDYNTLSSYKKYLEDRGKNASNSKEYNRVLKLIPQSSGYGAVKLAEEHEGKINDFIGRWDSAIKNQPTMQDVWNRVAQERGLEGKRDVFTGLMGQVGSVQQQLEDAPEQVAGETRGYDVNAAQQARLQQARQGELAKTLSPLARAAETAGTGYNLALAEAGQQISAEQYQQEKELQPYLTEAQLLDSALARQVTMYTTDMQNQTNILLQKLQNQGALDAQEMDRLNELAKLEREYELARNQFDYERKFKTTATDSGW